MLQSHPIARRWYLCSVLNIFALSVFGAAAVSADQWDDLKQLADSAGRYAAWRDICGDPDGADVRSDFLARVELLAPDEQAGIVQHFEKRYERKKKNGKKAVEACIRQGKTDCCTAGPEGQILGAKKRYDSHVASLAAAAEPAESSGSAAESAATVPAPTSSSVSSKESVAAAPTSPAVSGTSVASPVTAHDPGTGTMTLDGETRSFVLKYCYLQNMGAGLFQVTGEAKDDAGYRLMIRLMPGLVSVHVTRLEPERTNINYQNRGNSTPFRVDGSTVTVDLDGAVQAGSNYSKKYSIQMSFDCSG